MNNIRRSRRKVNTALSSIQYSIDLVSAVLLLTGQITTSGIFVVPEGFYLSATGEILGGVSATGQTHGATHVLRLVNVITALLLVVNAIRVTGPYITSGRMFLVFSGEIFGIKEIAGVASIDEMDRGVASQIRYYLRETLLNPEG